MWIGPALLPNVREANQIFTHRSEVADQLARLPVNLSTGTSGT